jgi:hypothetical protein
MTSIFWSSEKLVPRVRPPVVAWMLLPFWGATVRKAKSMLTSWDFCQLLVTVTDWTGQTPKGVFPSWYSGTYSISVATDLP